MYKIMLTFISLRKEYNIKLYMISGLVESLLLKALSLSLVHLLLLCF